MILLIIEKLKCNLISLFRKLYVINKNYMFMKIVVIFVNIFNLLLNKLFNMFLY